MDTSTESLKRSPYEVLQVSRWTDFDTIKHHYYALVKQFNPEYYPTEFIEIRTAFDILNDPNTRAETDISECAPPPPFHSDDYPEADDHSLSMFKLNQEWKTLVGERELSSLGDHERNHAIHLLRGKALYCAKNNQLEEAEEHWNQLLGLEPEDEETRRNLLYCLWMKGFNLAKLQNYSEAEERFIELLEKGAAHGAIHQNVAICRERQGKKEESVESWKEALEHYNQELKSNPDDNYLKAIVINLHKYTGGSLLKKPSEDGDDSEEYGSGSAKEIGYACIKKGNWVQAKDALERALKENPDDIDVICQLGWAYLNTNMQTQAFRQWNHALKLAPNRQGVVDHIVRGHTIFGKRLKEQRIFNQALVQFKNALKHEPQNMELRLMLAETYFNMGNYSSAVQQYNKILEVESRNKVARQGLREAKRLGGLK